ncbi:hypothetical protein O181_035519 [Austropuccinia psidii MF-1]|uniref:Uncharacterized protein n=1 Tax=Austropuccinia psidii MF-1 TaxID=1389203 RepID=A0A9Q3HAL6_9BASI|nr:hypothetical protein [Austropuccinia psidii MF-1]
MVRQENIKTASTVTSIIPASTVNSDHNSTVIVTQNNQPEPISSALINLDISNTIQKAKNLANNQEQAITPQAAPKKVIYMIMAEANRLQKDKGQADTATRSLSGYLQSQPEGLQQCTAAQRVADPCRSVEKLHECLPDCEKVSGPSQHLQVTQWVASIDGKEEHDAINSRMEEKQPSTTQKSAKNSPSGQKQQFQCEKPATSSEQGQRKGTSHKTLQPGLHDAMENVFQMARTMMELQKKVESILKYQ